MSRRGSNLFGTVFRELKQRKVFRVALVYALMAWGVMQVGELLFEALQVPEGAYTLLVILVLLGFGLDSIEPARDPGNVTASDAIRAWPRGVEARPFPGLRNRP